jgi:excisionase family DNA binding protein
VLLTVRDVARDLGVSVKTVAGYIDRGELRAIQGIGRGLGYRIRREWLEDFLRDREVRATGPADVTHRLPGGRERRPRTERPEAFTSVRDARARLGLVTGGKQR